MASSALANAAGQPEQPRVVMPVAAVDPWWRSMGDPALSELVEAALRADAGIACRMNALMHDDAMQAARERTLGRRIGRLFGDDDREAAAARRAALVEAIAAQRVRVALNVALAAVDVRRLQRRTASRAAMVEAYRDNAEIAGFRRQAGLVPAIDEAIASSQEQGNRAELGSERDELHDAIATLAGLAGIDPDAAAAKLAEGPPSPLTPEPAADARSTRLARGIEAARRSVRDARTAYREGAGSLATLYVAEAAALSLELAQIDDQARASSAWFRAAAAAGNPWASADLEPMSIGLSPKASSTASPVSTPSPTPAPVPFCD